MLLVFDTESKTLRVNRGRHSESSFLNNVIEAMKDIATANYSLVVYEEEQEENDKELGFFPPASYTDTVSNNNS